ncbi:MAG: HD domain-containing protein, partial [Betaproteobacteria bacterium]|nr:HD domain-containing protein [Betaproteobacteria bacterium]
VYQNVSINLLNLILSMSDAMDLASSELSQHQLRTAFVAWELGKVAALPPAAIDDVFIASLLHDIGALSLEDKIEVHRGESIDTERHCIVGERVLETLPLFGGPAKIVRFHHTPWHALSDRAGKPYALLSQIVQLADVLERAIDRQTYILHQHRGLASTISSLSGTVLSAEVVEIFESVSAREDFWLDLASPRLYSLLMRNGPSRSIEIDLALLTQISKLFRDIIDFRSRFTATHSSGVATSAGEISRLLGLTETESGMMEVAGNLHDLGKLAIPNSILNKPGPLDAKEAALMRQHTYFTYTVLNSIGGIPQIAEWAAFHHERLDGSGYPFHIGEKKLSIGARIMAVADLFTALAEDRPYRGGMDQKRVLSIMRDMRDRKFIDAIVFRVLEENYGEIHGLTQQKQAEAQQHYEEDFTLSEAR